MLGDREAVRRRLCRQDIAQRSVEIVLARDVDKDDASLFGIVQTDIVRQLRFAKRGGKRYGAFSDILAHIGGAPAVRADVVI